MCIRDSISKAAYIIVAMLIATVGWVGYTTLFGGSEPETIAFTETTTTTTTTAPTTTVPPDLSLTANEVDFLYARTIVRVVPYACTNGRGEDIGDPLVGVAVNDRSVLLGSDFPADANVAQIFTRTGGSRTGIVSREGSFLIATSDVLTNRHLEFDEISDEPFYYVGFELDSNQVITMEAPQGLDAEISVAETGALHEVRIGSTMARAEALSAIDRRVEVDLDARGRRNDTCSTAERLSLVEPPPEAAQNESDADLEEAGAE